MSDITEFYGKDAAGLWSLYPLPPHTHPPSGSSGGGMALAFFHDGQADEDWLKPDNHHTSTSDIQPHVVPVDGDLTRLTWTTDTTKDAPTPADPQTLEVHVNGTLATSVTVEASNGVGVFATPVSVTAGDLVGVYADEPSDKGVDGAVVTIYS